MKIIALAILAAHLAILIAALALRRIASAMLILNLALAIVVVVCIFWRAPPRGADAICGERS